MYDEHEAWYNLQNVFLGIHSKEDCDRIFKIILENKLVIRDYYLCRERDFYYDEWPDFVLLSEDAYPHVFYNYSEKYILFVE